MQAALCDSPLDSLVAAFVLALDLAERSLLARQRSRGNCNSLAGEGPLRCIGSSSALVVSFEQSTIASRFVLILNQAARRTTLTSPPALVSTPTMCTL